MKFNINKIIISFFLIISIIFGLFIFFLIYNNRLKEQIIFFIFIVILYVLFFLFCITIFFFIKKRNIFLTTRFNYYIEKLVSTTGVGLIAYNEKEEIIWASEFILIHLEKNIIGKHILQISPEFSKEYKEGNQKFIFTQNEIIYEVILKPEKNIILFKEVTNEHTVLKEINNDRLIIGELAIDNYQQFQVMFSEEELFKIKYKVIKMLDKLVDKHNFIYKEHGNGRYLIITNQQELEKFIETKFSFLNNLRREFINNNRLSVSIGFGSGTSIINKLSILSKEALLQSQARGGDQVCISHIKKSPEYYGSKSELIASISRVRIKKVSNLLENKLNSNKIKKVIIYGHKNADLDSVGSSLGVAFLASLFNKPVYIQNSTFDDTTKKVMSSYLPAKYKKLFISPFTAKKISDKNTLVIVCDTSNMHNIENPKAFEDIPIDNIFVFDHHRIKSLPSKINNQNCYINPISSSTCEIISEVFKFVHIRVRPDIYIAQMLLNGIYLDTVKFTKTTTSITFHASSYLIENGADSKLASEILKPNEETRKIINKIYTNLQEIKPGHFLATYEGEVSQDVISLAADQILKTQGRKAAYVIAKIPGKNEYKLSARSIKINVQVIAEQLGGGGHYSAAAAVSNESLNIFKTNLIQAIWDNKEES